MNVTLLRNLVFSTIFGLYNRAILSIYKHEIAIGPLLIKKIYDFALNFLSKEITIYFPSFRKGLAHPWDSPYLFEKIRIE